jgi:hypothetical protein
MSASDLVAWRTRVASTSSRSLTDTAEGNTSMVWLITRR